MKKIKNIGKALAVLVFITFNSYALFAQGWTKKYSPDHHLMLNYTYQLEDSTYWVSGGNTTGSGLNESVRLMRIDQDGNVLRAYNYDSIRSFSRSKITSDNGMAFIGDGAFHSSSIPNPRVVLRVDSNGNQLWLKMIHSYYNPTSGGIGNLCIDTTDNNGYIVGLNPYDTSKSQNTILIKRLNEDGDILWGNTYYDSVPEAIITDITNSKDGGFIVQASGFHNVSSQRTKLFKIDGNGNFLWEYSINLVDQNNQALTTNWLPLTISLDGNILFYGSDTGNTKSPFVGKLNQNGNELWTKVYQPLPNNKPLSQLLEIAKDTFAISVFDNGASTQSNKRFSWAKLDTVGNLLDFKYLPTANLGMDLPLLLFTFINTKDNGYLIGGLIANAQPPNHSGFLIKMDSKGQVYPNTISGNTFYDRNTDCERTSNEEWSAGNIISFTNSSDTFRVMTQDFGYYSIGINSGVYDVGIHTLSPYWEEVSCNPTQINIPNGTDTLISFGLDAAANLPFVTIDAHIRPRICASNTYTVAYCNQGPGIFSGLIKLEFDSILQIDSASIPWATKSGNTLIFLETNGMEISECKSIEVYYSVPCNMDLTGVNVCVNAHAISDSVIATAQWDQSNLDIEVVHKTQVDSVEFKISNIGQGDMGSPQRLIVIEDNVIMINKQLELNSGERHIINLPANGSTWRASMFQTENNPFSSFESIAIEGAGRNQSNTYSKGFYNQFPYNGAYGFDYTACAPIRNSYDPNQKTVFPEGAAPDNIVEANTDLEYTIDFQNTGNDTAYIVKIVDTLQMYLNPQTLKLGASSHPYSFQFLSDNVIEFTFEAIYLPDSSSNEQKSKGFVKFKIEQMSNNPNGIAINNSVGIYFDYNNPVITNIAHVKLGNYKVSDIANNIEAFNGEKFTIQASPNPFSGYAIIKVDGIINIESMTLNVFDTNGRLVQKQHISQSNEFRIEASDLSKGTYVFQISSKGEILGSGKIISVQ